ncbi:hypothetical protein [Streptomyces sp. NPDC087297]|uniref:hypothetical protein n=1 Tax=Streptomyces sp. NPDC087297 TaxID=3365778 RepID=UPI00381E01CF
MATMTALCPAGTTVIGGGYSQDNNFTNMFTYWSQPLPDGSGWEVRMKNNWPVAGVDDFGQAHAVCMPLS